MGKHMRYFKILMCILCLLYPVKAFSMFPRCEDETYQSIELPQIFPGAQMPIYMCYYDANKDGYSDVIFIFAFDENNETMEIIKALMLHEYANLFDMPNE